jgi:hypothetical protein
LGSRDQSLAMALPTEMSLQAIPVDIDELEMLRANHELQAIEIIQRRDVFTA